MTAGRFKMTSVQSGRGRHTRLALVAFLLICANGQGGRDWAAQAPGQNGRAAAGTNPQGGFVLHAQRNEVLVDVRVLDHSGHAITNLTRDDFRVLEDGVVQKINSFDLEDVEKLVQAKAASGPPPTIDLGHLPPNAPVSKIIQDHRLIVLFFDLTSMQVDDLMRALQAASHFVSVQMTPADLVSIVTYSSDLRVARNFTNDRSELKKALHAIQVGETNALSQAGSTGEAGTTDAAGNTVVTQDLSDAFTPDETEFNIFNTDEKLSAIDSLADMLSGLPGRKNVIHFSSGIEQTGIENEAQLRATVDAANRANMSLYTMDARGLMALPPGGDASTASPSGVGIYTAQAVNSQVNSMHTGRETLASLATDTGGRTFYDLNDFSTAFKDVLAETTSYYLIGYTPSNTRGDGRFRHIRVQVTRPGVKVEARPGYYAPKDFRHFTREDKELQLEQAMDLGQPFVELPLAVEAAHFLQSSGDYRVVLAAKIPGSAISFLQKSAVHRTEFDFAWRATDKAGHVAAALRDTLPVKLGTETYQQVLASNFLYEGGFVLPPGDYKLKVVVRENLSGKMGTFEQDLSLPPPPVKGIAVSSVVVSNQLEDAAAASVRKKHRKSMDQPLIEGGKSILPSVTRVFRKDQDLYIYLQSYEPRSTKRARTPSPNGAPPPSSFALVFFKSNLQISDAGPFSAATEKSGARTATYFTSIPLTRFPTGRYILQVNVLDPGAGQVAFTRIPIAIMNAAPPARPAAGR